MITEKEISEQLKRTVKAPIRIGSLTDLAINKADFIASFKPFFDTDLMDDVYLVKNNQMAFLKSIFIEDIASLEKIHQAYFEGKLSKSVLNPWIDTLSENQKKEFLILSKITRQRNISSFTVEKLSKKQRDNLLVKRIEAKSFKQDVSDFRVWKRVFKQASKASVENELFKTLLKQVFLLISEIHPTVQKIKIMSHFMRTTSDIQIKGENSPEGVHEDGAKYIVSALVINRTNILGGETQIFEAISEKKELIFNTILEEGEFAFQADTGEEKEFGTDLWHYVTPIQPINLAEKGVRDIIGFDIEIVS
ncbi:2OG-Fe dioxygenase family protein [Tenacibaculum finnmarkense]|uniref:2OG-Fe dioxygenase family protein n=1 Tax=Tenacibaculum finnmarkense TaxID=2781243 RepID=UPI001EFA9A6D|nr:2OG-Fe dioxygenase family protein [Tenacibaculum finnmarkense]MCG8206005.1 2OG-Fe dioxygenase family protein [Tenacibaculum finnmarkense genomovar finnmarkense]MCG8721924.1 2OG-Fe dioxygenase family protein [Tenacibaculum finnmarkense]MCG8740388.1 2OG-Fe dioxygenase family protein [Tenacibaculum finnmarkense]MCG8763722.1 2OG-Fe dioxygenase family protein [Tenacibaculum finnmarkense]MCG8778127.1 2OG-Fe dioxygenase family protein [Tenacibaculum finnmarkense]